MVKAISTLQKKTAQNKMNPKIFPALITFLFVCAAIFYGFKGEWKEAVYSALAVGFNYTVYFWR